MTNSKRYHVGAHDLTPDRSTRFGPFKVRLVHDDSPLMPGPDWDCMAPILTYSDGMAAHDSGDDIESFFRRVSDAWISKHWRRLCDVLAMDQGQHDSECRDYAKQYGGGLANARREQFEERLAECKPPNWRGWGTACDYFGKLESLYHMAGIPALDTQRNGYSQGDCIRILVVLTPEHAKRCGYNPKKHDGRAEMESAASLYGAWAFGDCWGYSIDRVTEDSDGEEVDSEHVDSCFGFFGAYWDKDSGLHDAIESALNHAHESAERGRRDKLKTLIRNRVPLHLRGELLGDSNVAG